MDYRNRTLPEEKGWDHMLDVDDLIEAADYAFLYGKQIDRTLTRPRVLLVMSEGHTLDTGKAGSRYYTALEWREGDGLHYDGDGSVSAEFAAKQLQAGDIDVTSDWAECERFIAALPVAA